MGTPRATKRGLKGVSIRMPLAAREARSDVL
jgi:hypothetical protein